MSVDLNNLQGDLWSRGFPKYDETFYFFTITDVTANNKQFHQLLPDLVAKKEISTLKKVKDDWREIADWEKTNGVPKPNVNFRENSLAKSNALIAFSMAGLKKVSAVTRSTLTT